MRRSAVVVGALLTLLVGLGSVGFSQKPGPLGPKGDSDGGSSVLEVTGRTKCPPGRKAIIAPVPLHPVVEVLVAPGDRVKRGQPLVKLDDDEPRAEVRAKKAALENAKTTAEEARALLGRIKNVSASGAVPSQIYIEVRTAAIKAERDERAAKAALEGSEAELEHYTVTAPIDGVVAWLDVHLGMVSRPGTTVWGEILDLSEVDVLCELTPEQVESLAIGQTAEVLVGKRHEACGTARITFIGIAADKNSGLVPVTVRLPNPKGRLRCEVPVLVRFTKDIPAR
jgi:RND family efflux transporter MFP subunit